MITDYLSSFFFFLTSKDSRAFDRVEFTGKSNERGEITIPRENANAPAHLRTDVIVFFFFYKWANRLLCCFHCPIVLGFGATDSLKSITKIQPLTLVKLLNTSDSVQIIYLERRKLRVIYIYLRRHTHIHTFSLCLYGRGGSLQHGKRSADESIRCR